MLCKWEELLMTMQTPEVKMYYDILDKKRASLVCKRCFDIIVSAVLIMLLLPFFVLLAVAIKCDSSGPVFYRQVRITQYGRTFRIHKFRSMVVNADQRGSLVTVSNDSRITRVGCLIRKYRLDEVCQLLDVLAGNMTLVGTRPEVPKYVKEYNSEMMATLLLPAGITSLTSIFYANEGNLLDTAKNPDKVYCECILPEKMKWNLEGIRQFSFWRDIKIMFMTFFAMCGKEYKVEEKEQ